jgi:transposase InsO family protein
MQIDLIDMRHLPDRDYHWIMHAVDHWSKFNFAYAIPGKHATHVAACLEHHIFPYFGVPRILHSDNGREFVNRLISELLRRWHTDIQLISGCPRHPQSQGVVERAHATLERKLSVKIRESDSKSPQWSSWLPCIICKCIVKLYMQGIM